MRLFNPATGAYADQPAKSFGLWSSRGWTEVVAEPDVEDENSAAEADQPSRGKPSARQPKEQ